MIFRSAVIVLAMSCLLAPVCSGSYISGLVLDAETAQPIGNIHIKVYSKSWEYLSDVSTITTPSGEFVTGQLEPGRYYLRAAPEFPQPYIAMYWPEATGRDFAQWVPVESGANTKGIDFHLPGGGYILGVITNGEVPLKDLDLDLYDPLWNWLKDFSCRTENDGSYILQVPEGQYFVRADPDAGHGCQQRYWPDAYYREDAVIVAVHRNDIIYGIDFTLPPGGTISGTVRLETGGIIEGCHVYVYSEDWIKQPIHQVKTDEAGSYVAFGLPAGSYYLKAYPGKGCGYEYQYYPSGKSKSGAKAVPVAPEAPVNAIDFLLPEGNFELTLAFAMPATQFIPGDTFFVDLNVRHEGAPLEDIPVFVVLHLMDAYYFWPSWRWYHPPEQAFLDYRLVSFQEGANRLEIIPSCSWPETATACDDVEFLGAALNRSLSQLASNLAVVKWGFR